MSTQELYYSRESTQSVALCVCLVCLTLGGQFKLFHVFSSGTKHNVAGLIYLLTSDQATTQSWCHRLFSSCSDYCCTYCAHKCSEQEQEVLEVWLCQSVSLNHIHVRHRPMMKEAQQ